MICISSIFLAVDIPSEDLLKSPAHQDLTVIMPDLLLCQLIMPNFVPLSYALRLEGIQEWWSVIRATVLSLLGHSHVRKAASP